MNEWMNHQLVRLYWLIDWLNDWLNEWSIDWLASIDWLIDWLNEWMNEWMNEWTINWSDSTGWLIDWLIGLPLVHHLGFLGAHVCWSLCLQEAYCLLIVLINLFGNKNKINTAYITCKALLSYAKFPYIQSATGLHWQSPHKLCQIFTELRRTKAHVPLKFIWHVKASASSW